MKNFKLLPGLAFILIFLLIISAGIGVREKRNIGSVRRSGFSAEIQEAENLSAGRQEKAQEEAKKAEEEKIATEEKKRKEEETRRFIAAYGPCRTIPILMYHHVGAPGEAGGGWLYVTPAVFSQQMDYLNTKGYTPVALPDIVAGLLGTSTLPAKPVVITFDDGYRDFHVNAYPILRPKNIKATVFIITQLMEGVDYLTWEQARELAGNSLITIGDHTLDHRSMEKMTEEELRNEIINSKNILEANLGKKINVFAYPFGTGNSQATKILSEAGFIAAVTASRGFTCAKLPYGLSRIRIGNSPLSSYGL
jgi:peptidoglycan/xylan/chitin deacetylase (PgdA/CDA1 family)